tara:strand:+ start:524 stop:721 length:198 start_codon:yes stop_codon:yes gene_type:complete
MKLAKMIEIAKSSDRVPADVAEGLLGYGITEFLAEGLSYNDVVDLISKAEIAVQRSKAQEVSFNR